MRIFVYEHLTGCGLMGNEHESLLAEGLAMLRAIVTDFSAIKGFKVTTQLDAQLSNVILPAVTAIVKTADEATQNFTRLVSEADHVLLIAPEFCGILHNLAKQVEAQTPQKLVGPCSEFIRVASDKQLTANCLRSASISVPHGMTLNYRAEVPHDFPFPAVVKPQDGAGSQDIQVISDRNQLERRFSTPVRIEEMAEGVPVSVGVLCGPTFRVAMPTCRQNLSQDGCLRYLGGELPVDEEIDRRARCLALAAINAMPPTTGYVGVDLVMGGESDMVIEVNPRLTTSYVGLREVAKVNLAEAIIAIATGDEFVVKFSNKGVKFSPDGKLQALHESR